MKLLSNISSSTFESVVDNVQDGLFVFPAVSLGGGGILPNQLATEDTGSGILTEDTGNPIITES